MRYRYKGRFISEARAIKLSNLRNVSKHVSSEETVKGKIERAPGYREALPPEPIEPAPPPPPPSDIDIPSIPDLGPDVSIPELQAQLSILRDKRPDIIEEIDRFEKEVKAGSGYDEELSASEIEGLAPLVDEQYWIDELFEYDLDYYLVDVDDEGEDYEEAA